MAVTGKKLANAVCRRNGWTRSARRRPPSSDQKDPAQQENSQEDLAQFRIVFNDMAQIRSADSTTVSCFARLTADQAAAAGELVDLAGEHSLVRTMRNGGDFDQPSRIRKTP